MHPEEIPGEVAPCLQRQPTEFSSLGPHPLTHPESGLRDYSLSVDPQDSPGLPLFILHLVPQLTVDHSEIHHQEIQPSHLGAQPLRSA
jgi:hypothetical protein